MNKRTSKELTIFTNCNINCKLGTVNKYDPSIIYIRAKAKLFPNIDKKDYSNDIKEVKKNFNKYTKLLLNNNSNFDNKHIVNFELGENCLSYNKKSNVKYDIFLKPNVIREITMQEVYVKEIVDKLNNKLIELFKQKGIIFD